MSDWCATAALCKPLGNNSMEEGIYRESWHDLHNLSSAEVHDLCQSAAELDSSAKSGLVQKFQSFYCCPQSGLSNGVTLCHINDSFVSNTRTHTHKSHLFV